MSNQPASKHHRRLGSVDKKEDGSLSLPVNASVGTNELQLGARKAYDRLRSVGMPATVTFEGFFAVYSLGSGGGNLDMGRKSEYEDVEQKVTKEKRKNNRTHGPGHWGKDGNSSVASGKQLANSKDVKSNWRVQPRVAGKYPAETPPNADRHQEKGKWQEAFDIVSERLIGRAEVARVRANILALRERSAVEDPMEEAEEEQERLYRSLASVKKEWELESKSVAALHERERNVRRDIENQKRVLLFLSVLERKGIAKMRRIGGLVSNSKATEVARGHDGVSIADLVKALRVRVTSTSEKFRDELDRILHLQPSKPFSIHVACQIRRLERFPDSSYKHTQNALANLHSYHTKLMHSRSKHNVDGDLHGRLENALKVLGVLDVVETNRKLVAVATLRAERKRRLNRMKWLEGSNAQVDLDDMLTRNERKAMYFQDSLKKAVALGWVCEGYIDMISTFCSDMAPELVGALEAESRRVEGHVDKMKAIILKPRPDVESKFVQEVRKIMNTTRIKVWEDVEESLKRSSLLTNAFQPPLAPCPPKLMEQGHVNMDVSRVTELLERKLQKSKHGYAIAQEIRTLLDGQKKLKYI